MSNSFKFFASYLDAARQLREKERGELLFAIVSYGIDGEEIPLRKSLQPIWSVIKPTLEKSRKLQSYGEKGGRPKKPPFDKVEKPPFQDSKSTLLENEKPDKDKEYGIRNKDKDNKKKPSKEKAKADVFADFADGNEDLLKALRDFNEMRTRSKKPMTDRAKKMLCNKLSRDFEPSEWINVLEQSVYHNWQDVYDRKDLPQQPVKRTAEEDYTDLFAEMFGGQENDNTVSGTACEVD